ncbi:hypothetical protein WJM95_28185 [Streptomyces sp. f51]|uniref:hypothetical protein n=1 Tax=Streptomyces sp. f51 TaxID=1827742 RepID=UPI0030CFBE05
MLENIIGGLIVAGLGVIWKYVLVPAVYVFYGRGEPAISGRWETFDVADCTGPAMGEMIIKQRGRHVRMHLTRTVSRSGRPINRKMTFKGRWQSEQLTATFNDDSAHYRGGVVVLRWVASARPVLLAGRVMYWDRTPDAGTPDTVDALGIVSSPYGLKRKD